MFCIYSFNLLLLTPDVASHLDFIRLWAPCSNWPQSCAQTVLDDLAPSCLSCDHHIKVSTLIRASLSHPRVTLWFLLIPVFFCWHCHIIGDHMINSPCCNTSRDFCLVRIPLIPQWPNLQLKLQYFCSAYSSHYVMGNSQCCFYLFLSQ